MCYKYCWNTFSSVYLQRKIICKFSPFIICMCSRAYTTVKNPNNVSIIELVNLMKNQEISVCICGDSLTSACCMLHTGCFILEVELTSWSIFWLTELYDNWDCNRALKLNPHIPYSMLCTGDLAQLDIVNFTPLFPMHMPYSIVKQFLQIKFFF